MANGRIPYGAFSAIALGVVIGASVVFVSNSIYRLHQQEVRCGAADGAPVALPKGGAALVAPWRLPPGVPKDSRPQGAGNPWGAPPRPPKAQALGIGWGG